MTAENWGRELANMGVDAHDSLEEIARFIAANGKALVSCYRFQVLLGELGTIVVCHDLGRGLISLGTSRQWGHWHEDFEVLTLDESGEKYSFEGKLVDEGDGGSCSLGNF
ncbi:MAG: hypothetical protein ACOZF2_04915 [Thermodesulfobacteriota bacterium]